MTLLTDLKELLAAKGITEYTDEQLEAFILETKTLISIPGLTPHQETDIDMNFEGDTYVTSFFPILADTSFSLLVNDKEITPSIIEYEKGIIHLPHNIRGKLKCVYTTGFPEEEISNDLLPIVTRLVQETSIKM